MSIPDLTFSTTTPKSLLEFEEHSKALIVPVPYTVCT